MQLVYGVVGAVVGWFVGGPSGAYYGFVIGYSIGGVIEASNQKIVTEGPRLSDLKVTISSYGVFIPRVYVQGKISGNIVEATDLKPTAHETSTDAGKGGPTSVQKTTTYSSTFRVMVCKSDGDRTVMEIFANGKLIWSRDPDADPALLLAAQKLVGQIIIYTGADDQLPDPTSEAIYGVGKVPAYLGVLSVMFVDFELADYSNNVAATQLTFNVIQSTLVGTQERLINHRPFGLYPMLDESGYTVIARDDSIAYNLAVYQDVFDGSGLTRVGSFLTSNYPIQSVVLLKEAGFGGCPPPEYAVRNSPSNTIDGKCVGSPSRVWLLTRLTEVQHQPYVVYDNHVPPGVVCSGETVAIEDVGVGEVMIYSPLGQFQAAISLGPLNQWRERNPDPLGSDLATRRIVASDKQLHVFAEKVRLTGNHFASWLAMVLTTGHTLYREYEHEAVYGIRIDDVTAYVMVATEVTEDPSLGPRYDLRVIDLETGDETARFTGPRWAYGSAIDKMDLIIQGSDILAFAGIGLMWKWTDAGVLTTYSIEAPQNLHAASAAGTDVLRYTGPDFYLVAFESHPGDGVYDRDTQLYLYTGDAVRPEPAPVSRIIRQIAAEKDFDSFDFSKLPDDVTSAGYIVSRQTSARVAIDYLRDFYRIDCAESGAALKMVRRGYPIVRELTRDDLGAYDGSGDPPEALDWGIVDELSLPAEVVMKYADRNNNWEIGAVRAKRENTTSTESKTLDVTALSLTGSEAAKAVEQALLDFRIARETFKFSTSYAHEDLEPTDPVLLPGALKKRRGRLTKKSDRGGWIDWEATRDEPQALTQYVIGGAAGDGSATPTTGAIPVTRTDILNLASLRLVDDDAGYYTYSAPTAVTEKYQGATVYDQAKTAPHAVGTIPGKGGARGFASTILPTYSGPVFFDESAFVDAEFAAGVELLSASRDRVQQGDNVFLIGDEIVGVCVTTSLGSNRWRLHGGMLRGLRGTESAIPKHGPGEKVLWLSASGLIRVKGGTFKLGGTPVTVGAVSAGRSLLDLQKFSVEGANLSTAQRPFAPRDVVCLDGGSEIPLIVKWTRRSRKMQADPFAVPPDDSPTTFQNYQSQSVFAIRAYGSSTFPPDTGSLITNVIGGGVGDRGQWIYSKDERYANYLRNAAIEPFWISVAQVGPNGVPGEYSTPILADLSARPREFPYGLMYCSTAGADGSTTFTDPRALPEVVVVGTVHGAVHKQNNRAVFAGGEDSIVVDGSGMPLAIGIGTVAIQTRFKTTATGPQTILYHGTAAFTGSSWKLVMDDGRITCTYGEFSTSVAFFTTSERFNDGVEHILEFYVLPAGKSSVVLLRMDEGRSVGAGNNFVYVGSEFLSASDNVYVMGNDRSGTSGFVGTMGDLRGTTLPG